MRAGRGHSYICKNMQRTIHAWGNSHVEVIFTCVKNMQRTVHMCKNLCEKGVGKMCVKNVCEKCVWKTVWKKMYAKMSAKNVQGLFICGGSSCVEGTNHQSKILHHLIF